MASIFQRVLSWLLACLFTFAGAVKLYPVVPKVHAEMKSKFVNYATVCPTVLLGYTPNPDTYRMSIGVVELLCVAGIILGSKDVQHWCCGVLMIIMTGALYTHAVCKEFDGMFLPLLLFIANLYLFTRQMVQEKSKKH